MTLSKCTPRQTSAEPEQLRERRNIAVNLSPHLFAVETSYQLEEPDFEAADAQPPAVMVVVEQIPVVGLDNKTASEEHAAAAETVKEPEVEWSFVRMAQLAQHVVVAFEQELLAAESEKDVVAEVVAVAAVAVVVVWMKAGSFGGYVRDWKESDLAVN